MIIFLQGDYLVPGLSLDTLQPKTLSSPISLSSDILSPLTEISDDEDAAFLSSGFSYPQEVVVNTNFNPYLDENHKFPCGRSEEERLDFTNKCRESVEEHAVTPSTLEEFISLVFLFL